MYETYVVHITKLCNMKCAYCYETDKSSEYTWDEIKTVLDGIVKYNNDKKFYIEFLGGEPCLCVDLIVQTVDYLESLGDVEVLGYTITTNGTLINDSLIDLMKKYKNVSWSASIDGTRFMNFMRITKNNENSYDQVIENFNILKDHLGDDSKQLGCHMVTHPYNIGYYIEGIKDLYGKGFRFIDVGTVESTILIDKQYCDEFIRQNMILSDMIKSGKFPGLIVSILDSVKPEGDEKHYITDENGRVLAETFGRVDGDIKDSEEYKTPSSYSELGDTIPKIRQIVYDYHNR